MTSMRRSFLFSTIAVLACACSDSGTGPLGSSKAYFRVFNTAAEGQTIDASVDGKDVVLALGAGHVSPNIQIPAGTHSIGLRVAGNVLHAPPPMDVTFSTGDTTTVFVFDSSSVLSPWVLPDTGALVAPGKTKLRVANFVTSGPPVLFYRTQPDAQTPLSVMFPFPYGEVSPYMESTPGDWQVFMSTEHYSIEGEPVQLDTLATSPAISIPVGQSRTVVFFVMGGQVTVKVLAP